MRNILPLCLILLGLMIFFSCKKDEQLKVEKVTSISFLSPQIGQKSYYILLQGDDIKHTANLDFQYINDTLVTEIIDIVGENLLIKETLTPNSVSLNGENHISFADSTVYYELKISVDKISIKNLHHRIKSRIFFIQDGDNFGLDNFEYHDLEVKMESWKTNIPFSTEFVSAYLSNFSLFEKKYDHLNVAIDNRPMKNSNSGYTHVYSLENGLVRSSSYSHFTNKGFGWDLIPN